MSGGDERVGINPGYPMGQLASAFVTALTHEDAATRQRAEARIQKWQRVLEGMRSATLEIGSRTPVKGVPAWVTPEVVRGGFATGAPAAAGPLTAEESAIAQRLGIPADRRSVFAYWLTEEGVQQLSSLLQSGRYTVDLPEGAALLAVAWLLKAGDRLAALELLDVIEPLADQLRFSPPVADVPAPDAMLVWRRSSSQARVEVARRRPNARIETMHEALTVWNPFADELLAHWLDSAQDGRVETRIDDAWVTQGSSLLDRYRSLAAEHTRCTKHRRPKENLAVMRRCLEVVVAGRALPSKDRGLLQHVVDSMVARRAPPGSTRHRALRDEQGRIAAAPTYHAVGQVVLARLASQQPDVGLEDPESILGPTTEAEERLTCVAVGSDIPESIRRAVRRTLIGTVEDLMQAGVVVSAEVLAELVPQIAASTISAGYGDEALRQLMSANYRAFRRRRSLLLLNLEHQVTIDELPWVKAVGPHRERLADFADETKFALARLGELALQGFPGTLLPNPLIRELDALSRDARLDLPFVEELAADIFMGRFSGKFTRAAKRAADVLAGTIYERYYDIDYEAVRALEEEQPKPARFFRRSVKATFADLCIARAGGRGDRWSVASNGKIIEHSQILTTHNLAVLVADVGVSPSPGWAQLARSAFDRMCQLIRRVENNPRPLATVKDAAYAWRQTLVFLSIAESNAPLDFLAWSRDQLTREPPFVLERVTPILAGLDAVATGGRFDANGTSGVARRFLGWTTEAHWLVGVREPTPRQN